MESLNKPTAEELSQAELKATIESLKAQLAAKRASEGRPLTFKVSDKGCLSIYGLQRFPVSLRTTQWERVIKAVKDGSLEKFIADHAGEFQNKQDVA